MSNPIPSFIDVTPFGPYCTQCSIPLAVEKGILQHGKARHPEIPIRNAFVVRAVKGRIANLRIAHAHDFSPFLKLEQDPHHIWFCTVCFSSFLKASNYKRHIEGHNNSCISVNTEKVGCFPTICGRMGPISCTVLSVVSTQSHLSSVSTVTTSTTQESPLPLPLHCHTAASTNVPPPLMTTQDEAITYLSPFVRSDEDVCDLALIYYPLLGPSFEGTMKEYLQYSAMTMPEEPMLAKWIEVGRLWLSKYAAGHISNVSANVRNRLAEFEQRELDGISVGTRTFALRRGIPRLMCELDSALRFFFRFPTTLFDEFKTKEVQLADAKFLIRTAIIPRILYTAAREEPVDHGQIPIACRYCLSRGFTTKSGTTLAMNECGWFSSRISALMHLLRAGVCGYLVTLSVQKSNRDLTMYEMELVKGIQHGRVTNLLAPYVKRLRDLNGRKPPVKNNTVNGNGDITSGAFTFSKSVWCTLIPRLVQISKNCFAEIFEGHTWQLFISDPVSVADWVLLDASTHVNGIQYFLQDLEVRDQIQPVLVKLQSIAELCLCGLGAGAVRHEEVMRLKVNSCQWHNSYLYFWTESLKQGSMKRRAAPKMVEHRLSLTLSKIFLLIRQSMKDFQPLSSTALICKFSEAPMLCLVRDIFDFDYEPMMLNVRHLFTSIGNILLPEKSLGTESKYVSSATLTEKSGHTQSTGRHSYSTWLENGEEALYDFYHKELGEEFLESPKIAFTPFSDSILLVSLKRLLGPQSLFRSPQQKQMVSFAVNSNKRHAYVSIPCGQGKSMSWFVPIMASLLSGRHIGLRIVILPYKFLLGHMVEQANLYFGSLSERIQVNFADSSTITKETFPSWLTDRELPSLLFLNLDAAEKMLC